MSNYARCDSDNIVVEVVDQTAYDTFVPIVKAMFKPCPIEVQVGWVFTPPDSWSPPPPVSE